MRLSANFVKKKTSSSAANRRRMTACFSLRHTGGHAGRPLHRQKKLTALHFRYPRKLRSVPSFFLSKSNPLRWVSIWILYRKPYGPPCVAAREKSAPKPTCSSEPRSGEESREQNAQRNRTGSFVVSLLRMTQNYLSS